MTGAFRPQVGTPWFFICKSNQTPYPRKERDMANFLDNAPSLFIQTGEDKSQLFGMNFARNIQRHFVMRLTGGCGLMTPEDAVGLANLQEALSGGNPVDNGGVQHPRF